MHILVNTGGGDAPGLNAVIQAVTVAALRRGWKVTGIRDGYEGLLQKDTAGLIPLTWRKVHGIAHLGGTILGTKNFGHPFAHPITSNGKTHTIDVSKKILTRFKELNASALIVIGGDGSLRIAHRFHEMGMPLVAIPKTIDNDLCGTVQTFGFDTAVSVATDAIGRLHTTAESHSRVMVVEVMGRHAGWIALYAGLAGGADVILIPEINYNLKNILKKIKEREKSGINFSIVVAAEGAKTKDGNLIYQRTGVGKKKRLGGLGEKLAQEIEKQSGKEARAVVLGYLQRAGSPTHSDRILSFRFGTYAVELVAQKKFGNMVAYLPPQMRSYPIVEAIKKINTVPLDSDILNTARELGISFGD